LVTRDSAEHRSSISGPKLSAASPRVQRAPVSGDAAPSQSASSALLVDDKAVTVLPGQMRRNDFLAQLRAAGNATAQDALTGTAWSAEGCPWIDHWFGYYAARDATQIERALRLYAPGAGSVRTAAEAIPIVAARVRSAISTWLTTGATPT